MTIVDLKTLGPVRSFERKTTLNRNFKPLWLSLKASLKSEAGAQKYRLEQSLCGCWESFIATPVLTLRAPTWNSCQTLSPVISQGTEGKHCPEYDGGSRGLRVQAPPRHPAQLRLPGSHRLLGRHSPGRGHRAAQRPRSVSGGCSKWRNEVRRPLASRSEARSRSAALGPALGGQGLLVQRDLVRVAVFAGRALLVHENAVHQEPRRLIDVDVVLCGGLKPSSEAMLFAELVHLGKILATFLFLVTFIS